MKLDPGYLTLNVTLEALDMFHLIKGIEYNFEVTLFIEDDYFIDEANCFAELRDDPLCFAKETLCESWRSLAIQL